MIDDRWNLSILSKVHRHLSLLFFFCCKNSIFVCFSHVFDLIQISPIFPHNAP